jgi:hypothetical protein
VSIVFTKNLGPTIFLNFGAPPNPRKNKKPWGTHGVSLEYT